MPASALEHTPTSFSFCTSKGCGLRHTTPSLPLLFWLTRFLLAILASQQDWQHLPLSATPWHVFFSLLFLILVTASRTVIAITSSPNIQLYSCPFLWCIVSQKMFPNLRQISAWRLCIYSATVQHTTTPPPQFWGIENDAGMGADDEVGCGHWHSMALTQNMCTK